MELREPFAACAVAGAQTLDLADNEAGVFQDLQVLGDGCLGEAKLVDELPAVAGVVGEQQPHDPHASGVAKRLSEQRDIPLDRDLWCDRGGHETLAVWWRAPAATPAGIPRSGFTCGISCGQA